MRKSAIALIGCAIVVSTLGAVRLGGWAVVTVDTVSDYFIVGKPLTLTFTVRQHGDNLLSGLKPSIEAKSDSRRVEGKTWELPQEGTYRANITVPEAGDWKITINSGFGRSKGTLLPWRAVDATTKNPPALIPAERGRQLFAAKGCVTCHVHRSVDIAGEVKDVGPDLSDRRFPAEYLAAYLADPSIKPPVRGKGMPNMALREPEIASLVAFINSERRLSTR
jgi:mono/diheme cytochrome c family protein